MVSHKNKKIFSGGSFLIQRKKKENLELSRIILFTIIYKEMDSSIAKCPSGSNWNHMIGKKHVPIKEDNIELRQSKCFCKRYKLMIMGREIGRIIK